MHTTEQQILQSLEKILSFTGNMLAGLPANAHFHHNFTTILPQEEKKV